MRNDDITLIQRILAGDAIAFERLVGKYQKQVHTLAWRKIGDFHIAEDITQEIFLQVYQKLETLEDPTRFPGWLYVIADRLCIAWFRRNQRHTEPLEDTDISEVETEAYSPIYRDGTRENFCRSATRLGGRATCEVEGR